jgi:hypothetical protein
VPSDDEWQAAADAIFGCDPPDVAPLARLVARATHIPPGIRDMLAAMLDPDGAGYLRFKFELKNLDNKRDSHEKETSLIMPVAMAYNKLVSNGKSAQEAAEIVAENFYISDRLVFTYVKLWKERLSWLNGGL